MRIVAWNIRAGGGVRATVIAEQLMRWHADVVALTEFRGTAPSLQLAEALSDGGLAQQSHSINIRAPTENRLLLASRWPIEPLSLAGAPSRSGKWIAARVCAPQPFTAIAIHVPNRATGRKWPFHAATLRVARTWSTGPALLCGDTNTGRIGIDEDTGAAGFNLREDCWMTALEDTGWHDAFRRLHGDRREWTWHSPNAGTGYRLDQAFVNTAMVDRLRAVEHVWGKDDNDARRDALSDHAALIVDFDGDA
ncbi:MAG: endonuclease/exonuclease/phosphatase family protein [Burkholderiales bacterium]